jgi:hypothetical protein
MSFAAATSRDAGGRTTLRGRRPNWPTAASGWATFDRDHPSCATAPILLMDQWYGLYAQNTGEPPIGTINAGLGGTVSAKSEN